MKIFTTFIIAAVVSLSLTSCSKDDKSSDNNPSGSQSEKMRLITLKPWKLTGKTYFTTTNPQHKDIFSLSGACFVDNIYTYKTDNKVITDEGATKCNSGAPQTSEDTWAFMNGETELKVGTALNTIVSLDENTMVLQHKINEYTYHDKYTH